MRWVDSDADGQRIAVSMAFVWNLLACMGAITAPNRAGARADASGASPGRGRRPGRRQHLMSEIFTCLRAGAGCCLKN